MTLHLGGQLFSSDQLQFELTRVKLIQGYQENVDNRTIHNRTVML